MDELEAVQRFEAIDAASEDIGDDVQSRVTSMLQAAVRHFEDHIEPDLVDATKYYFGEPFGDEVEGRSKVVMTPIRDAVQQVLPSLMRIFYGVRNTVEFLPRRPDQVEPAKVATKYLNVVVKEDNPGFLTAYSIFKDMLTRRMGIVKWFNEDTIRSRAVPYSGLTEDQVLVLMEDPRNDVQDVDVNENEEFSCTVVRTTTESNARYVAIPPEEFITSANPGPDLDKIPCIAHVRYVPSSDLVAMGVPREAVEAARETTKRSLTAGTLDEARQRGAATMRGLLADEMDDSMLLVLFAEAYILIDTDDDGIAERRMFWCVGEDHKIVNGDNGARVDDMVPFAVFPMDPEPHTLDSLGFYDYLKDVQRVTSQLQRSALNSLALALEQKTEVVEGMVNIDDLLEPAIGGVVRVKRPGMMREVNHTFLGGDILAMAGHWQEITENRTGRSKAAMGLDADSLQSSTKQAVAGTLSRAQQQTEMIARIAAEVGMKRLYKGLLKLVVQHQNKDRVARLAGAFVQIDPSTWDIDMDVEVRVAIGGGTEEEQIMFFAGILSKQQEMAASGSPLVSQVEIRSTLQRLVELAGHPNTEEFFKRWGAEEERAMQQQMAQQPKEPSIEEQFVQVEMAKVQAKGQELQAKMQHDMQKLQLEQERFMLQMQAKQAEMARDFAIREAELQLKYSTHQTSAIDAAARADREQQNIDLSASKTEFDATVKTLDTVSRAGLNAAQAEAQLTQAEAQMKIAEQNRRAGG